MPCVFCSDEHVELDGLLDEWRLVHREGKAWLSFNHGFSPLRRTLPINNCPMCGQKLRVDGDFFNLDRHTVYKPSSEQVCKALEK